MKEVTPQQQQSVRRRAEAAAAALMRNENWQAIIDWVDVQNASVVNALMSINPCSPDIAATFYEWQSEVKKRLGFVHAIEQLAAAHNNRLKEQQNG